MGARLTYTLFRHSERFHGEKILFHFLLLILFIFSFCIAGEACTGFWWGNLRERDRWGDPGVDGRIMLGWNFKRWDVGVRTGLGCLRIGISGGRL
jgi:hypothetical protein